MDIFQTHISVYNGVTDNTGTRMPLGTFLFCKEYKDDILSDNIGDLVPP